MFSTADFELSLVASAVSKRTGFTLVRKTPPEIALPNES